MNLVPAQYYFLADVHLGALSSDSEKVEEMFLDFLNSIPEKTKAIYLLGDIFDLWGEFHGKHPDGYESVLDALKKLASRNIDVYFFKGNHDYWTFGYLQDKIGLKVIDNQPYITQIGGKTFCLAHGDGLGKCGVGYSIIKFLFRNKFCIKMLGLFPPEAVFRFGRKWSNSHKNSRRKQNYRFKGTNDRLAVFSASLLKENCIDYFIYGHIHRTQQLNLDKNSQMLIVGDWFHESSYISYDEGEEPQINKLSLFF